MPSHPKSGHCSLLILFFTICTIHRNDHLIFHNSHNSSQRSYRSQISFPFHSHQLVQTSIKYQKKQHHNNCTLKTSSFPTNMLLLKINNIKALSLKLFYQQHQKIPISNTNQITYYCFVQQYIPYHVLYCTNFFPILQDMDKITKTNKFIYKNIDQFNFLVFLQIKLSVYKILRDQVNVWEKQSQLCKNI
eukprot:TRINITY_DN19698_c0_g2_i4.p1 TRINITY_DN19698_c0_g2~~TRINITY_DN19698_c0_g2_i4.p1  ORF type:complete len:190 (+),score=-20.13 TRINITY_DN19698_c0_g2_i4:184-753(+)